MPSFTMLAFMVPSFTVPAFMVQCHLSLRCPTGPAIVCIRIADSKSRNAVNTSLDLSAFESFDVVFKDFDQDKETVEGHVTVLFCPRVYLSKLRPWTPGAYRRANRKR